MKRINKYNYAILIMTALLFTRCQSLLEEQPRTQVVPAFLGTPNGLLGGIASVYNDIRGSYGTEGFTIQQVGGTDEHLRGAGASSPDFFTYEGIDGNDFNGAFAVYTSINTLNGVLQYLPTVPDQELSAAMKKVYAGQAHFLRAFLYFDLVQTYGSVPLHMEFITQPSKADSRASVNLIYDAIVADLTAAINELPALATAPFLGKAATKGAAIFLLGKVYLTRGWLNNNTADFKTAYDTLTGLINKRGAYGFDLWQDYGDAFKIANDYGKENIFVSDHSIDPTYGLYQAGASGGAAQNLTPWFHRWNYSGNVLGANSTFNTSSKAWDFASPTNLFNRDVENGRPYFRFRPAANALTTGPNTGKSYIYDQAFVKRDVDTRYAKTFKTVWIVNKTSTGTRGTLVPGDTGVYFVDYEEAGAPHAIGTRPFKGIVVTPSKQTDQVFPAVSKFDDNTRAAMNDPSTRPVVLMRFADAYLLAAEAALQLGNKADAATLLNVVRRRGAYKSTNTGPQNDAAAGLMEIDADDVTLDFILDERTREFYGEGLRRIDLVRTRSLLSRVAAWNPTQAGTLIKPFHMLRPIPQDQIDRVTEGECKGNECWQNEGYF